MSMGSLAMVAESVGGRLVGADARFDSVSTDTRRLKAGQLFVALRGEHFDAADFVPEAAHRGAAGAVVERCQDVPLGQVKVRDSRRALGDLARVWREQFSPTVIAVTGSNGKTTVKEMIAAILRTQPDGDAGKVLVTAGNLNNDIGLPLTVLKMRAGHRVAVLEMGASHRGEIGYLAQIARPGVSVITNAAPAHLAGFGTIDEVAAGKGELVERMCAQARGQRPCAVLCRDDAFFAYWKRLCSGCDVRSFGLSANAAYSASGIREQAALIEAVVRTPDGAFELRLPMSGRHNILNALAATAAAGAAGATLNAVRRGLEGMANMAGRLKPVPNALGIRLYDDSYNANPSSVSAAIDFLAGAGGPAWLVLGDMAELGGCAGALHREIGERARQAGIERLLAIGAYSRAAVSAFGTPAASYPSIDALAAAITADAPPGASVLIKGSRSMGLEKLVALLAAAPPATGREH